MRATSVGAVVRCRAALTFSWFIMRISVITLMRMMNHENVSAARHRTTAPTDVARTRSPRVLLLTVIVADY